MIRFSLSVGGLFWRSFSGASDFFKKYHNSGKQSASPKVNHQAFRPSP
jgi:hypothetical protein